jgi:hypothetical protein
MSLQQYSNNLEVIKSNSLIEGKNLTNEEYQLGVFHKGLIPVDAEVNIYLYDVLTSVFLRELPKISTEYYTLTKSSFTLDLIKLLQSELGVTTGNYKVLVDFTKTLYVDTFIRTISPSRTEVAIQSIEQSSMEMLKDLVVGDYIVNQKLYLDFGRNRKTLILNSELNNNNLEENLLKLKNNVAVEVQVQSPVKVQQVYITLVDSIYFSLRNLIEGNELEPNLGFDLGELLGGSIGNTNTEYTSTEELLTTDASTKVDLLGTLLSGSIYSGTSTDYRYLGNYVHFSSAQKRLNIFRTKLGTIENLNSEIVELNTLNSGASGSIIQKQAAIDLIKTSLDGFEKYLYYTTSSAEYYTGETVEIRPWPKDSNGNVESITGSNSITYFSETYVTVQEFDRTNRNRLVNNVPALIAEDPQNLMLLDYVDMMGHHYDSIYERISLIKRISLRDELYNQGVPADILYETVKSMGWQLVNGTKKDSLPKLLAAKNSTGVKSYSKSSKDLVYEVWNRVLNNLPELYKKKSTRDSFNMFLNIYGVPEGLIDIQEYGGNKSGVVQRINQVNNYNALRFDNDSAYVSTPWAQESNRFPDTVSFFINPFPTLRNDVGSKTILRSSGSFYDDLWKIELDTDYDTLQADMRLSISSSTGYVSCEITGAYLLEGYPSLVTVERSGATSELSGEDVNYTLRISQQRFGEKVLELSGSIYSTGSIDARSQELNTNFNTLSTLKFGEDLKGYLYEIRYYNALTSNTNRTNFTLDSQTFDGLTDSIIFRHPIRQYFDLSTTGSLPSLHPERY